MNIREHDDDLVELGAASVETHGAANIGPVDQQTGARYLFGGIEEDC